MQSVRLNEMKLYLTVCIDLIRKVWIENLQTSSKMYFFNLY